MPPKKQKSQTEEAPAAKAAPTGPRLAYHILYVKDMKAAVKFYGDTLGWQVSKGEDEGEEGGDWEWDGIVFRLDRSTLSESVRGALLHATAHSFPLSLAIHSNNLS